MTTPAANQPQIAEFQKWFDAEKAEKGLVDLKFYLGNDAKSSCEDILAEANAMLKAETLEDPEIF